MRNSIAYGWTVVSTTVGLQCLASLGLATVYWIVQGGQAALAAGLGGMSIALGNALFAVRLLGARPVPPRQALRALYAAEIVKILLVVALLVLALTVWKLAFGPIIAGMVLAQIVFWIALVVVR